MVSRRWSPSRPAGEELPADCPGDLDSIGGHRLPTATIAVEGDVQTESARCALGNAARQSLRVDALARRIEHFRGVLGGLGYEDQLTFRCRAFEQFVGVTSFGQRQALRDNRMDL